MNIETLFQLGPELILLVGACLTLIVGAQRVSQWF